MMPRPDPQADDGGAEVARKAQKVHLQGAETNEMGDELDIRLNGETAGVWPSTPDEPGEDGSDEEWRGDAVSMGLDKAVAEDWDADQIMNWLGGPAKVAEGSDQHYGEQAIEDEEAAASQTEDAQSGE